MQKSQSLHIAYAPSSSVCVTMTNNKIISTYYFPHNALPKVYNKPMFYSKFNTHALLKQYASSTPTSLARGNHSLLALILDYTKYNTFTGQVWIKPIHPGPLPMMKRTTCPCYDLLWANNHQLPAIMMGLLFLRELIQLFQKEYNFMTLMLSLHFPVVA